MRTDSVNLSGQAIAAAKAEIVKLFGEKYSEVRNYKTKTKGAQEAHEAIRPSYMDKTVIDAAPAEKRLYDLIWKRTIASQMAAAQTERTVVDIEISNAEERFVATGETVLFDGFLKLYSESTEGGRRGAAAPVETGGSAGGEKRYGVAAFHAESAALQRGVAGQKA